MDYTPEPSAILEELRNLDAQIDAVTDLTALKPIFYRLEEINREHSADFDVQMMVSDVKQHLMARGTYFKQQGPTPASGSFPTDATPAAGVPSASGQPAPLGWTAPFASTAPAPATGMPFPSEGAPYPPPPTGAPPQFTPPYPAPPPAAQGYATPYPPAPASEPVKSSTPYPPPAAPDQGSLTTPYPAPSPFDPSARSTPYPAPPTGEPGPHSTPYPPLPPFQPGSRATPYPPPAPADPGPHTTPYPPLPPFDPGVRSTPYPPPSTSEPGPHTTPYPPLPPFEPAGRATPYPPPAPAESPSYGGARDPLLTNTLPTQSFPEPPREVFVPPVRTPTPPPTSPEPEPPPASWKKPVLIGGGIGLLLVALIVGAFTIIQKRKPKTAPPAATIAVDVSTVPAGADVRINDQSRCKSNCRVDLAPGSYNLLAVLPGYEDAFQKVTVEKGKPLTLSLTLTPQAPSLKLLTDLGNNGKVLLDDNSAGALQDGQMALDKVAAGQHTFKITGEHGAEAAFSFQVTPGAAPALQGPITAKNLAVVVASGMGGQIHVASSITPMKIALDGNPVGEAGPQGIDLNNVSAGDHELDLNDGKDERKLTITAGATPVLTAWVNANSSGGTLVINAGEDGATVFLDGKAYPRKTRRGQLWIPNLPPRQYKVKVVKAGFQDVQEQTVAVNKGAETRLAFKLQAKPQIAVLHISGGTPGATVLIDGQNAGVIGADGSLSFANVAPGSHKVEIRRDQFATKDITQTFRPGETLELSGDSVVLERAMGTLRLAVTPREASVTIRAGDDPRANPVSAGSHQLPAGTYTLQARASGYADQTVTVQIKAGDSTVADLRLNKEAAPPKPVAHADWLHPQEWKNQDGWLVHRGGNFVPFGAKPGTGVYTFSVQLLKGGVFRKHIQWRVDYVDEKNYINFQLDKKSLESKIVSNGKETNRPKVDLNADEPFTLQIEINPDSVVHKLREGSQWVVIDRLPKPGVNEGRFGFYIPGKEEIAISGFSFTPR